MQEIPQADDKPFIPADQSLPEITVKGTILAIFLTVILCAANAFLGLKVGLTIAASIPAAVVSMGVLRLFKHSNILENNIVQTAASTGEAITSGLIFIVPALIMLHYWTDFNYFQTAFIGLTGGILGVLFSVPLRRVLLADPDLHFPEGVAIGNVLKASASTGSDVSLLVKGGILGALIEFAQDGLGILANGFQYWKMQAHAVFGFGLGFSPALLAAGYIIGFNVALAILTGVLLGWIAGVPVISYFQGIPAGMTAHQVALHISASSIRYMGVGAMASGGLWTLFKLAKPVCQGLKASFVSIKKAGKGGFNSVLRTERDVPLVHVLWVLSFMLIFVFCLILYFMPASFESSLRMSLTLAIVGTLYILFMGFVLASLSGYFAGLVGATNNPASSMIIAGLLLLCLILAFVFKLDPSAAHMVKTADKAILAIMIMSVIGAAITIANDTIQDLKAGQMVGATPWKQQAMLMLGATVAAFALPLILQLLYHAYGIGGVFPRPGMDHAQMLAAPQAGLMTAIAQGVFHNDLPWGMFFAGVVIAIISIFIDSILRKRRMSFPVLGVGLGIYLPLEATIPVIVGGMLSFVVQRTLVAKKNKKQITVEKILDNEHNGILLACGAVAGASLTGVLLAIPFAIERNSNALRIVSHDFYPFAVGLAICATLGLCAWIYRVVLRGTK